MSFDRLHPEIWTYLLTFLAVPLPKPLSGVVKEEAIGEDPGAISRLPRAGDPGTTSRKDIRADALAKLMRTSIAFNQLASVPLYKRVITDSLPSLTSHLDSPPAHPRIQSKLQLLKRVRYLHLEYNSKTRDPTYPEIMLDRRHLPTIGVRITEVILMSRADIEAEQLNTCITSLVERKPIFPSLITISTAAIFGPQYGLWQRAIMHDPQGPLKQKIQSAVTKLEPAFRSTSLVEWCNRGSYGPLALSALKWDSPGTSQPTPKARKPLLTAHVNEQTEIIPTSINGRTRWVLENHIHGELMISVCQLIVTWVNMFHHVLNGSRLPENWFDIEIYASGRRTAPDTTQLREKDIRVLTAEQEATELARMMGIVAADNVRSGRWTASRRDIYRFKSLPEASRPCAGCAAAEPCSVTQWAGRGGSWLNSWKQK